MHGSAGLHSAMAIKRQRRLREQAKKRAAERRLSSRTDSIDSITGDPQHFAHPRPPHPIVSDHRLATSIGMLHIGVCFLVLGLFLIGSGLLPDDMVAWRSTGWWNELVATGIFVVALGLFLIILNRVVSKREEDDLTEYVQRQLTRSRSGHRLERDVETGCLTTKHHRRMLERRRAGEDVMDLDEDVFPVVHTVVENPFDGLEKIDEERQNVSNTTTASVSPGTPCETKELICNVRQSSFNSRQY